MDNLLTLDYLANRVLEILPVSDGEIYSSQVRTLVSAAISKMNNEGVHIDATDKDGNLIFTEDAYITSDYVVCLSYQVLKDMDYDVNYDFMTEQYITRVNTLRCNITRKQNSHI